MNSIQDNHTSKKPKISEITFDRNSDISNEIFTYTSCQTIGDKNKKERKKKKEKKKTKKKSNLSKINCKTYIPKEIKLNKILTKSSYL